MRVTVVRPDELGISEEKKWRQISELVSNGSTPLVPPTAVRAACRAYENGRVAVAEDDGAIRAFLPYAIGGAGIATTLGGEKRVWTA